MSSRRARGRAAADADGGHPGVEHPPPPPPPPEDPPREEAGGEDETPRIEDTDTGAEADGGGGTEAGATVNQGAMRAAVLEALSDPAVVRQLVAAVSSASSSSSASTSASAHDGKIGSQLIALLTLPHKGCGIGASSLTSSSISVLLLQGRPR